MSLPVFLEQFVMNNVDSEEQLDVLLLVRSDRARGFTPSAVGARLLMTPTSAERHLARLCGRGLLAVRIGTDVRYRFAPANAAIGELVAALAEHRESAPSDVHAAFAALRKSVDS